MKILTEKSWSHFLCCDQAYDNPQFRKILKDIDKVIAHPIKVLKNDAASTVVLIELDHQYLMIKRANNKSAFHSLRRFFSQSRAAKNWRNTQYLKKLNIDTFSPVAMYEKRWGYFRLGSYFICTYIDAKDALFYFSDLSYAKIWPVIMQNLIALIKSLEKHQISHRDLNLSNLLIKNNQPVLIDLESMRSHRFSFYARWNAKRERRRLIKNWQETTAVMPVTLQLFKKMIGNSADKIIGVPSED